MKVRLLKKLRREVFKEYKIVCSINGNGRYMILRKVGIHKTYRTRDGFIHKDSAGWIDEWFNLESAKIALFEHRRRALKSKLEWLKHCKEKRNGTRLNKQLAKI